jgi:site-specific DNA recombinase
MTVEPITRVALYCRVSTEDQAERGTIQNQQEFLRGFATLYGLAVVDEYVDDGWSGVLPVGERPDGRRLTEDAGKESSTLCSSIA